MMVGAVTGLVLVVLCNGRDMSEIPKPRTGRARPDAERFRIQRIKNPLSTDELW